MTRTVERLIPERLETALSITGNVAGVDLKALLEESGRSPPAPVLPGIHTEADEWDAQVQAWLDQQPLDGAWTGREILQQAMSYDPTDIGHSELTRMGYCLRRLGLIARHARVDGRQSRVWRRRVH